jgi:enoyl-CoA hydratase/carnithine racemase
VTFEHLELSRPAEQVLQVTLNRPRQFNALAETTFVELDRAIREFEQSADHVLILTGAGRAFCFGADFLEFQDRGRLPDLLGKFQSVIRNLDRCPKITIASLNGFATGAGMDLALACDLRIASDRVKLGEAYISMGLVPDGGGSYFLPRMIGASRALKLLMTGESLDAAEAKALGLIHDLCPADQLASKTVELALSIASRPQTALRLIKKLVRQNSQSDLETALNNERESQLTCFEDPAHQDLVREFLAKRLK